ncbi:sensor histidine kinase [Micromonospora sp. GCM10011542]|uniref:sensor histidine kinase n=1 Tax=Micromonospora sp. GCM10011542 TaxID=3317337 RepID=UPI003614CDD3
MRRAERRSTPRPELRRAVRYFLCLNALAIIAVAVAVSLASVHLAREQAVHFAERSARGMAEWLIAPHCTSSLRTGDPAALRALDEAVRPRMRDGSVIRVKVWSFDGRVLYSDQSELIGRRYELSADDRALAGTDRVSAEISDLDRAEHEYERQTDRLVEVYLSLRGTDGEPVLFEAYFPADRLEADARYIGRGLAPLALLTIVALQLLQLPLALVLARRLDDAHRERGRLLEHAIAASDLERRRIARDLHDEVIQDLAGVGYSLGAVELHLSGALEPLRANVRRLAATVQRDVRALRRAMVDIQPPDLSVTGLPAALDELAAPLRTTGKVCHVRVAETNELPVRVRQLLYRSAREAFRNIDKHAEADRIDVAVEAVDAQVRLTIADDGVGFDPGDPPQPDHLGLRLLGEAVREVGGTLTITSAPGAGTVVDVVLPLDDAGERRRWTPWRR